MIYPLNKDIHFDFHTELKLQLESNSEKILLRDFEIMNLNLWCIQESIKKLLVIEDKLKNSALILSPSISIPFHYKIVKTYCLLKF